MFFMLLHYSADAESFVRTFNMDMKTVTTYVVLVASLVSCAYSCKRSGKPT